MYRLLAPASVFVAVFAPQLALAQVNIDQDKTPAHIFSSDCSVCHKSTRGLANGRSKPALTDFLAEHYTSSRQEATAMAAYVLAGGGGVGTPAPAREQKPEPDQTRPAAEEPKTREAGHPTKPPEEPAAEAKPTGSPEERGKPTRVERSASAEPGSARPEAKPPEGKPPEGKPPVGKPSPAARLPRGAQKPATVAAAPRTPAVPGPAPQASATPSAAGEVIPPQASPGEASPAPTDDIPD